jgi:hypothetical protein
MYLITPTPQVIILYQKLHKVNKNKFLIERKQ